MEMICLILLFKTDMYYIIYLHYSPHIEVQKMSVPECLSLLQPHPLKQKRKLLLFICFIWRHAQSALFLSLAAQARCHVICVSY